MKRLALLIALLTITISCNKAGENEYIITGAVKDIPDGKSVFLEKQGEDGQWKAIDTAKIEKGVFTFSGTSAEPEMHLLEVETINGKIPFILENGDIDVNVNKDSIMHTKVTGTYNNDEFMKIKSDQLAMQKKVKKFEHDNGPAMQAAQQSGDTVTINKLRKDYAGLQDDMLKKSDAYISSNPKSHIALLMLQDMLTQPGADVQKLEKYFQNFDASLKNSKPGKKVQEYLTTVKATAIGGTAPAFSAPTPDGKQLSLKDAMGKITIVDFWASWCKPCRAENPNVVAIYKDYHGKGLNIIGVSLDSDAKAWKDAIAADGLVWSHVANLNPQADPIAKSYNITSVPTTFILDANGKILARDLRGDELRAKVASLLDVK